MGKRKIEVACISNCRDIIDVKKFGFKNIDRFPDVLPWIMFQWKDVRGRLYMIGSTTENVAGREATNESIEKARGQFLQAVEKAHKSGAKVVLFAASTKRLFKPGELEKKFPKIVFTIGDNYTGLLIGEMIKTALLRAEIKPDKSKSLSVAPYGFLGSISLKYLLLYKSIITVMGRVKRKNLLEPIASKFDLKAIYDYKEAGTGYDIVVACNSAMKMDRSDIDYLRKKSKKLILIDPNEPPNMTKEEYFNYNDVVLRYDAGNGYSNDLKYTLGFIAYRILRLKKGVIWGCFCEAILIAKYFDELKSYDWRKVDLYKIAILQKYYDRGDFTLPAPTNFNRIIENFSLEVDE